MPQYDRRRKPTRRASYGAHSLHSYQPPKRSKGPIVLALVAVAVLVAAGVFVFQSCSGQADRTSNTDGQAANSAASSQEAQPQSSAAGENDGRIVMTLMGDEDTLVLAGESYIEAGCHAVDKKAKSDLSKNVQVAGEVDTNTPGDYTVTYSVQNESGMQASRTRTVHVVDDIDADEDGIPVMMYHHVYTDDDPPETDDTNYLHADKLASHLEWLQKEDYYFPSYPELVAYIAGTHSLPKKSVILTFDDGQMGFFKHGVPLFEQYKVPVTSFVIGDRDRTPKCIYKYASEYVSYQSHSYGLHNDGNTNKGRGGRIYDLSYDELVEDSNKMHEMLGGYQALAYPYGDVSDDAPASLKDTGVLCAFTIVYGNVHKGDDPMRLNRVRVFAESPLDAWINQVKTGE